MPRERLSQGLIQVYTGDGKGKTTCALGLALRAIGQGFQVCMVQFMKGWGTGEARMAAERLAPDFTLRHFGRPALVNLKNPDPEDLALIHNLIPLAEGLATLRQRPAWVEVVLTGRQAPTELIEIADLVTEMRLLKHYYEAGVPARRGIEW